MRYVEDNGKNGVHNFGHGHHHHHHKRENTSDKAKSDHTKSDHDGEDTDQVDEQTLHDGAIDKIDDANHRESNATMRKVCLILLIQNYEAVHPKPSIILSLHEYLCIKNAGLHLREMPRCTLYSKSVL